MAKSQTQCWWVHLLCVQCQDSNILIWGRFLYDLSFFLGHSLNPAVSSLKHAVSAAEVCWCLGTFYYSCFHSLPTSLPQKRWQKWAPCWPRQAVGFCKLTTLIMSFCYSDTQSSGPPHWLKMGSDVKSSMSWGRSHVCTPPPTLWWSSKRRWKGWVLWKETQVWERLQPRWTRDSILGPLH